jgi:hypothetical protein
MPPHTTEGLLAAPFCCTTSIGMQWLYRPLRGFVQYALNAPRGRRAFVVTRAHLPKLTSTDGADSLLPCCIRSYFDRQHSGITIAKRASSSASSSALAR